MNAQAIALVNTETILQSPLYTEDDKATTQKAIFVNWTNPERIVTFSGHGITNAVNYTDMGQALIISRGISGVIESKGRVLW